MERQATDQEEKHANHISHKRLTSWAYPELSQVNSKNAANLLEQAEDVKRDLTDVDSHVAGKPMNRFSTSLATGKMKIDKHSCYHGSEWPKWERVATAKAGQDSEETRFSYTASDSKNWGSQDGDHSPVS